MVGGGHRRGRAGQDIVEPADGGGPGAEEPGAMTTLPLHQMNQVLRVPTGVDRLGFPTYGKLPAGVPNPPNAILEGRELQEVRIRNAQALASPQARHFTEFLAEKGGTELWGDFAKQYRRQAGFLKGWVGTGMMYAAMGIGALKAQGAKSTYQRLRPFQVDPQIRQLGKLSKDASYPSGHATSAYAAATVLSQLWPARANEFGWWANQVGQSRMAAGMHFPSDVRMGAALGMRTGASVTSILYR